jgi:hypothetical protein
MPDGTPHATPPGFNAQWTVVLTPSDMEGRYAADGTVLEAWGLGLTPEEALQQATQALDAQRLRATQPRPARGTSLADLGLDL